MISINPNTHTHAPASLAEKNLLFPVFLKTDTARFLIVGGGNVGLEKTETLLRQNPRMKIVIVATVIYPKLRMIISQHSNITAYERAFEYEDLEGIDFAIIATDNPDVSFFVKQAAQEQRVKVNAADQPALCDFYLGSIVNKGNMKLAISTNGKSPVMARRMREYLEESIPDSVEESIDRLHKFRKQHRGNLQEKLADLNQATQVMSDFGNKPATGKSKSFAFKISALFLIFFVGYGVSTIISPAMLAEQIHTIPNEFYGMLLIGFIAQLIDGAVGLGYGVTCATSMMLLGIPLPAISGSIHTAEMFSSGMSGYSHYKFGNVNKRLLYWIAIPGVIGACLGAAFIIYLGNQFQTISYAILAVYTMIIGIRLVVIAFRKVIKKGKIIRLGVLGFTGGFLDAFSGGGWGPIVTSTLLAKGRKSSYVVGTVSLAEFFVTFVAAVAFFISLGISHWYIVLGLVLGGSVAAPFAAKLTGRLPQKVALISVAILVMVFSVRILFDIL